MYTNFFHLSICSILDNIYSLLLTQLFGVYSIHSLSVLPKLNND